MKITNGPSLRVSSRESPDVVRQLISYICEHGLVPGDRLPSIRELAQQFEAGPNVIRDALMRAATMGLVKIHPRSGVFVQSLNYSSFVGALAQTCDAALLQVDHNLFHLLDARRLIEVELVGQAAQRRRLEDLLPVRMALDEVARGQMVEQRVEADVRFHLGIAKAAGQEVLEIILQGLLGLVRPFLLGLPRNAERWSRTDRGHDAIYRALLDEDAEQARTLMAEHLRHTTDYLINMLHADSGTSETKPPSSDGKKAK
jgi:GntR family transcriptional repressor for pyruvate dehydrogenase complex